MTPHPVSLHKSLRQSLFVAGTDTGVGKTYVTCQLLRAQAAAGYRTAGMKPVAAGAVASAEGLRNDDALALQAAANVPIAYELMNPVCLATATSPHLAAADAGIEIDIAAIVHALEAIQRQSELVLVEGAGGWLAPVSDPLSPGTRGRTMQDVAQAIGLPVLLVVGIRLGCLNHALLTVDAILRSGLPLAGWAANCVDAGFSDAERYVDSLQRRLTAPLLWRS